MRSRDPAVVTEFEEPSRPAALSAGARFFVWSSTPTGLAALFAVGLLIRLWLARGGGFPFDMWSFAAWAGRLADKGTWHFYPRPSEKFFVDYPPGYLYILYALGKAARLAGESVPPVFWLKLPPILGDLGLAWLVGDFARRVAPAGRRFPIRGVAAAAILFNPAVIFVSAVWGQADSVYAVLVVGAFVLLGDPDATLLRESAGAALASAAIITKPQTLFVVPVIVLVLAWRHLRGRAADSEARPGAAAANGIARLASIGAVGAITGLALAAPFRMTPTKLINFYAAAAKTYQYTSVFAFNLWGAIGFWRPDAGRSAVRIFGVPAGVVGIAVFVVVTAMVLVRAWRALSDGERQERVLAFGGIAITLVAFATLTRIHERYLYLAVALLAAFVGSRRMRWALVVLSALFFVNVYYPYVYYLRYVHRRAPDLGGLFDNFYGHDGGGRLKLLSLLTGVAAIALAAAGWRWLTAIDGGPRGGATRLLDPGSATAEASVEPRPPWTLRLQPVGRRGALLALGVFVVAFASRVAGLGHPPGMYFDEVYHARTGAEYLNHKEVYEWTHPPLAKELIAVSIKELSRFHASPVTAFPAGVSPALLASGDTDNVWAVPDGSGTNIQHGTIGADCRLRPTGSPIHVDVTPEAIAASGDHVFVAGVGPTGRAMVRFDGRREAWRAALDGRVRRIAPLANAAYVLQNDGTVVAVDASGVPKAVATKSTAITSSARDSTAWAAFASPPRVASWDAFGKRTAVVGVPRAALDLAAPEGTQRVVAADTGNRVDVIDAEASSVAGSLAGPAQLSATVPETQLAWVAGNHSMAIVEPRGATVLGRVELPATVQSIVPDPKLHRMVAITEGGLSCVSGRPTFAWRFGSAVMGAAMAAFVVLLALRLFGSLGVAALAGLFITIDGLAFTISRIAMNDSYVTGFMLAAWFCLLSALYRWGRGPDEWGPRSRTAAVAWLTGAGVFGGLALASKWVGLYALVAFVLLVGWDLAARKSDGLLGVAGSPVLSLGVIAFVLGVVPLGIYVASYVPYFQLGHSFTDLIKLQEQMYAYHANLKATHPFGSSWYGWPFGHKAVFLYLANHGSNRSEIWTIPNIAVFWGGAVAMVAAVARARRTRNVALVVVVGAGLAQYLPWTIVSRVTFLYHFLPVVPFLAIALAWYLVVGLRGWRYQWLVVAAVTVVAVAFFFATLPALEGWSVPGSTLNAIRRSLPWILPP